MQVIPLAHVVGEIFGIVTVAQAVEVITTHVSLRNTAEFEFPRAKRMLIRVDGHSSFHAWASCQTASARKRACRQDPSHRGAFFTQASTSASPFCTSPPHSGSWTHMRKKRFFVEAHAHQRTKIAPFGLKFLATASYDGVQLVFLVCADPLSDNRRRSGLGSAAPRCNKFQPATKNFMYAMSSFSHEWSASRPAHTEHPQFSSNGIKKLPETYHQCSRTLSSSDCIRSHRRKSGRLCTANCRQPPSSAEHQTTHSTAMRPGRLSRPRLRMYPTSRKRLVTRCSAEARVVSQKRSRRFSVAARTAIVCLRTRSLCAHREWLSPGHHRGAVSDSDRAKILPLSIASSTSTSMFLSSCQHVQPVFSSSASVLNLTTQPGNLASAKENPSLYSSLSVILDKRVTRNHHPRLPP